MGANGEAVGADVFDPSVLEKEIPAPALGGRNKIVKILNRLEPKDANTLLDWLTDPDVPSQIISKRLRRWENVTGHEIYCSHHTIERWREQNENQMQEKLL